MPGAVIQLAANPGTARKAAIKRASSQARAAMNRLDRQALDELARIYHRGVQGLQADILAYGDAAGSIRLEVLQDLKAQAEARLAEILQARNGLLDGAMIEAATLGVQPFAADAARIGGSLSTLANEAVQFSRSFVAADGLQLSDRIWRIDNHTREVVSQAIESAVIQGHSASRAAQDFLAAGRAVPAELAAKMGMANAQRIAGATGQAIMTGTGSPYDNALRLFRTELNRAHGEAYQAAAFEHPDVIGTRFLLSPNHPEADICDMHARVNRYGLGPGVYPKGKNPWPAHPNTLSYTEVVFADEVTEADRAGKEDRIGWLKRQPPATQEAVLASRKKRAALQRGLLTEGQISTPWKTLKVRLERNGIDTEALAVSPLPDLPGATGKASGRTPAEVRTDGLRHVLEEGERTGFEHAVVYDVRTGTEFLRKTSRSPNSVSFDRRELSLMADPRNRLDLVHNHPSGSSLSVADLRMGTLPGIERITAYGHDGSLYSARSLASADRIQETAQRLTAAIKDRIWPLINAGRLSTSQAQALHHHIQNLALDRLKAIEYSAERIDGMLRSALGAIDDRTFRGILDSITQEVTP